LYAPAALGQQRQELELGVRQLNGFSAPLDEVPRRVDQQVAKAQGVGFGLAGFAASQDFVHPQDQLAGLNGLVT
jgi:hypothetical protein